VRTNQWLRALRLPLATIFRRSRGSLSGFFNTALITLLRNVGQLKQKADN
jgi:hypothetical protein